MMIRNMRMLMIITILVMGTISRETWCEMCHTRGDRYDDVDDNILITMTVMLAVLLMMTILMILTTLLL